MDLFQRPSMPGDDSTKRPKSTKSSNREQQPLSNSTSFATTLRQWLLTQPSSFNKHIKEWTVCPTHDCITETPRPGLRPKDGCEFCWINSDVQRCIEASSNTTHTRDAWRSMQTRRKQIEEEDFWRAQENKSRSYTEAQMGQIEKDEAGLWLAYTLASWDLSTERRRLTAEATSGRTEMMPPHPNEILDGYVLDNQERECSMSLDPTKIGSSKLYCFEHDAMGDLVMHRDPTSYRPCGICLLFENNRAPVDGEPTSSRRHNSNTNIQEADWRAPSTVSKRKPPVDVDYWAHRPSVTDFDESTLFNESNSHNQSAYVATTSDAASDAAAGAAGFASSFSSSSSSSSSTFSPTSASASAPDATFSNIPSL